MSKAKSFVNLKKEVQPLNDQCLSYFILVSLRVILTKRAFICKYQTKLLKYLEKKFTCFFSLFSSRELFSGFTWCRFTMSPQELTKETK